MSGLGVYICDDGSTPQSAECADGTIATFYSDTTGLPTGVIDVGPTTTTGISLTTVLIVAVIAYFVFGRHS